MSRARFDQLFSQAVPLHNKGDLAAAEAIYRQVLEEFPDNPDALHLLGVIARQRGELHRAIGLIEHAIEIYPKIADFHGDLARVWLDLGRYRRASEASRAQLRLDPNNVGGLCNLADALWRIGEIDEAIATCRKAIEIDPNSAGAHGMLALTLSRQGDQDAAIAAYRQTLRLDPDQPAMHSNLIFAMHQHDRIGPMELLAEMREWNRLHGTPPAGVPQKRFISSLEGRKLRIGWVSPDFRSHVVGRCMLPVFKAFDRNRFENLAYSNAAHLDEMSVAIRGAVDGWQSIYGMTDPAAADLIRKDQIDVLVDLALHTGQNRLGVFSLRPAPIQACYLGYCGGTGLDAMDYRISHPDLDPPNSDLSCYTEKTAMLTGAYLCYQPLPGTPDVSPLPARAANGVVTFGCLNNPSKISQETISLWSRVLREVSNSRLILHSHALGRRETLLAKLNEQDIASNRVEFVGAQPWARYMETYNRIDIALDTYPYGAGITACDAIYMGVPVLALTSDRPVGRLCAHVLNTIGHPELVSPTGDAFLAAARKLSGNLVELEALRRQLRPSLIASPMMNAAQLSRQLEALLVKFATDFFAQQPRL